MTATSSPLSLWTASGGEGAGTIVLLHGLGATAAVWNAMLPFLESEWRGRWIVPDLRGHGRSPAAATYGIDQHAADVAGLVEPGSTITVVGHSMGGVVALALASGWFGITVDAALAIGIKVVWTEEEAAGMAERARAPVRWFDSREEAADRYLRVAGLTGLAAADDDLVNSGLHSENGRWRLAADPLTLTVGPPPMAALLGAAAAPVTLACGENDAMVSIEQLRALDPTAKELLGLGHNAMVEDPAATWALVRDLITSDKAKPFGGDSTEPRSP